MLKISDAEYRKFVILANPRTGSTLLRALLSSHPNIVCRSELLNKKPFEQYYPYRHFGDNLRTYLTDQIWNYGRSPGPVLARGFKLMYHTFKRRTKKYIIDYLLGEPFYIIHLVRKNVLNVCLSAFLSRKLGVWGGIKYPEFLKVTISPTTLRQFATKMWERSKKHDEIFHQRKIKVFYEDLCADQNKVMQPVLDFLGVSPHKLRASTVKQRIQRQSDHIENYWELKEEFQGTEYTSFFED